MVAAFTFFLPELEVPKSAENLSWHERLGLDALTLLKNRDTRVVFITTMLFNIPLAAFYPYAPTHLRDLGLTHTSAWMSLAQCSEVAAMLQPGLAAAALADEMDFCLRPRVWRAAVRVERGEHQSLPAARHRVCMARRSRWCSSPRKFTSNNAMDTAWRARAQALLTLMNSGVGNLIGYLGTGWWFAACTQGGPHALAAVLGRAGGGGWRA